MHILVNQKQVHLLQPINEEIVSLAIFTSPFRIVIPTKQAKLIVKWLYDISQKTTHIILFNNIIIQKEDVEDISSKM